MSKRLKTASAATLLLLAGAVAAAAQTVPWALHEGAPDGSRHSPLSGIDARSISRLGLAWSFEGFTVRGRTHRGMQATPIVVDGVLYVSGPWSVVYALDARTGRLLWQHDPAVPGGWARKACCDVVNRGVAVADGIVYLGTLDGYLVALDAKSGAVRWRVDTLVDRTRAYTITGAPRLAGPLVVIGNGGGEFGVRGYVSAHERSTGRLAWRFFTVPGTGPDEHPEVALARQTWPAGSRFEFGLGGTVWDSMSFDPALDLLYVGVGNGSPWPAWVRSPGGGDNLFLSSIVALEASTGRMRWHYQTTPADSWDYTATQNMVLADRVIDGRQRKLLLQAPKNGFFYALDRVTGELISARPYTETTWASAVDPANGRPVVSPAARYEGTPAVVTPSISGGHNWQPMAFSPLTGLVYIPVLAEYMTFLPWRGGYRPDTINVEARVDDPAKEPGRDPFVEPPMAAPHSVLVAWDPVAARAVWSGPARPWWGGGILSTAGGLVFQGGSDGQLIAHDAATGRVVRSIAVGTAISAPPISYAIDGVQYLAFTAGLGGSVKAFPHGSAALERENYERLIVLKLDGSEIPLPPRLRPETRPGQADDARADPAEAARGLDLFMEHCSRCHAPRGARNNYPDLWELPLQEQAPFTSVVLHGALEYAGMPRFDDVLAPADARAIREFILQDRDRTRSAK